MFVKIAVLGGGGGAHAMAADLALASHEIRMAELPSLAENVAAVQALGGIQLTGVAPMGGSPGFARLALVTTNIPEAVEGADLIMVVVPAYGHEAFMRELIGCVRKDQTVVFHSSYFSSLIFEKMLSEAGRGGEILFGETASLLYLAHLRGAGKVWIKAGKRRMPFAAFPASRTEEAMKRINPVYPQLVPAKNVFDTSLNEAGVLVHPITTLMNLSRIELNGPYRSHYYDLTPGIGKIMDAVDGERQAVQAALGLPPISLPTMIHDFFNVSGKNSYEAILACPNYCRQTTPDNLEHRYISEDVPFGLVPMSAIGEQLGLDMSTTRSIIQLASSATGLNFWKEGRSLERMGLAGMNVKELVRHVS
jgi:opine dehydrogenase